MIQEIVTKYVPLYYIAPLELTWWERFAIMSPMFIYGGFLAFVAVQLVLFYFNGEWEKVIADE